jgi:peptide/nickel transport system ATP-binding protein
MTTAPHVSPAGSVLLDVRALRKSYSLGLGIKFGSPGFMHIERSEVRAVDGVSLTIRTGEVVGLVGESGSGKSTLGRCIVRLIDASGGRIIFDGEDVTDARGALLHKFRSDVQIIFQNPASSLNPRRRVDATIGRSLDLLGSVSRRERPSRIDGLLQSVGLPPHFVQRFPHQLSGGERQRVSIARALASNPNFVVCDEPVSALDVSVQATVLNLLADLRDRLQLAYLFISHDLSAVAHIADRIAVMYAGAICEEGPTDAVLARPNHPYTEALLSAVPTMNNVSMERVRIKLLDRPVASPDVSTGCPFHPRCPRKIGLICEQEIPPVTELSEGHWISCHLPVELLSRPAAHAEDAREAS